MVMMVLVVLGSFPASSSVVEDCRVGAASLVYVLKKSKSRLLSPTGKAASIIKLPAVKVRRTSGVVLQNKIEEQCFALKLVSRNSHHMIKIKGQYSKVSIIVYVLIKVV